MLQLLDLKEHLVILDVVDILVYLASQDSLVLAYLDSLAIQVSASPVLKVLADSLVILVIAVTPVSLAILGIAVLLALSVQPVQLELLVQRA